MQGAVLSTTTDCFRKLDITEKDRDRIWEVGAEEMARVWAPCCRPPA